MLQLHFLAEKEEKYHVKVDVNIPILCPRLGAE